MRSVLLVMKEIEAASAWSVYIGMRRELGNVPFDTFQKHYWPSISKEYETKINNDLARPYGTTDLDAALAQHSQAQLRVALGAVEQLMLMDGTLKHCEKLMNNTKAVQDAIMQRCSANTPYGNPLQVLSKLGVSQPSVAFQRQCSINTENICKAWNTYRLKDRSFSPEDFRAYCSKHLITNADLTQQNAALQQEVAQMPPLVRGESRLRKLEPFTVDCHKKKDWSDSSDEDIDAVQPALRTPPRDVQSKLPKLVPVSEVKGLPKLVSSKETLPKLVPIKGEHKLVPIKESRLTKLTPLDEQLDEEMPTLVEAGDVGHWSIFPPLFPHYHHRRHPNWYDAEAVDANILSRLRSIQYHLEKETLNFWKALKKAGLDKELQKGGPYTVFALKSESSDISRDELLRHIVETRIMSSTLKNGQEIATLANKFPAHLAKSIDSPKPLRVRIEDGNIYIDEMRISKADIKARNGIVHVLEMTETKLDEDFESRMDKIGSRLDKIGERPPLRKIQQTATVRLVQSQLDKFFDKTSISGSFALFAPTDQYLEQSGLHTLLSMAPDRFLANHLYKSDSMKPFSASSPKLELQKDGRLLGGSLNEVPIKMNTYIRGKVSVQLYGIQSVIKSVQK